MSRFRSWLVAALCLGLMAATASVLHRFQSGQRLGHPGLKLCDVCLSDEHGTVVATNSVFLPETLLGLPSKLIPVTREELDWLPRDTTFGRRVYLAPDGYWTQVSAVLMGTDRTSIHKPEYCLPGQGFQITRRTPLEIAIDRPHPYRLPVMRLDAVRETRNASNQVERIGAVYVYWFLSDSRLSNDHLQRMWWLASDLVRTGELQRWAYVGCLSPCFPGQEDAAYARIQRLIQALVPEFQITTGPVTVAADATTGAIPVSRTEPAPPSPTVPPTDR